jgi:hypothetical protein
MQAMCVLACTCSTSVAEVMQEAVPASVATYTTGQRAAAEALHHPHFLHHNNHPL